MQKNIIIGIIVLILVLGAIWYWTRLNDMTPAPVLETQTQEQVYDNATYGYSFVYPPQWSINEYTKEAVAVGTSTDNGFETLAEVDIVKSEPGSSYASYDDFLFERASVLCAADGPNETINCTKIERKEPFTSTSGLTGEKIYLELARANFADATTTTATSSYGPLYAFNVGANAPESDFAAMLIYPPLAEYLMNKSTTVVETIAQNMRIDRTQRSDMY